LVVCCGLIVESSAPCRSTDGKWCSESTAVRSFRRGSLERPVSAPAITPFAGAPAAESPVGVGSAGISDVARLEIHMQATLQNLSAPRQPPGLPLASLGACRGGTVSTGGPGMWRLRRGREGAAFGRQCGCVCGCGWGLCQRVKESHLGRGPGSGEWETANGKRRIRGDHTQLLRAFSSKNWPAIPGDRRGILLYQFSGTC
jgi:hypothetical protein